MIGVLVPDPLNVLIWQVVGVRNHSHSKVFRPVTLAVLGHVQLLQVAALLVEMPDVGVDHLVRHVLPLVITNFPDFEFWFQLAGGRGQVHKVVHVVRLLVAEVLFRFHALAVTLRVVHHSR